MCRQVGIILGRKRRRVPEHDILLDVFTEMLVRSERGGPHATGVAVLRDDGNHAIAKRPMPARRFVGQNAFFEALAGVDNHATAILGHTRWRTRGSEQNNRNNHPIRAGRVIGTQYVQSDIMWSRGGFRAWKHGSRRGSLHIIRHATGS